MSCHLAFDISLNGPTLPPLDPAPELISTLRNRKIGHFLLFSRLKHKDSIEALPGKLIEQVAESLTARPIIIFIGKDFADKLTEYLIKFDLPPPLPPMVSVLRSKFIVIHYDPSAIFL
jgi:hypothetical protein